jgi:hypothetical protein
VFALVVGVASGQGAPVVVADLFERRGTVNLLDCLERMGMVGSGRGRISGAVGQAVVVPVTSFQVVNRTVISQRYSSARSW